MMGWVWSLPPLQLILGLLLIIVTHIVVLGAATIAIAKWIANGSTHNVACQCGICHQKRARSADKIYGKAKSNPVEKTLIDKMIDANGPVLADGPLLLSTRELRPYMIVTAEVQYDGHLNVYKVTDINVRAYGIMVFVTNIHTNVNSSVMIHANRIDVPLWRVRKGVT